MNLSIAPTRFLRRQVQINHRVIATDQLQDWVATGTYISVCTVRHGLNADGKSAQICSKSYKSQKCRDSVLWSDETELEMFSSMDQRCVWRKKNEAYVEKSTLSTIKVVAW